MSWSPPPVQPPGGGRRAELDPDIFAPGPGLRFRTYTCVTCGHRSPTWDLFKAHRARPVECREGHLNPSSWWFLEQQDA